MYDRQTGSLWSHITGEAVSGEMLGTKLELVPAMHTEWGLWKELYPDTLVMRGPRGLYRYDPYEGYYRSGQTGVIGQAIKDNRLHPKEFVIGLRIEDKTKAYPFSILSRKSVVNDTFENIPLVVAFDSEGAAGAVLDRRLDGLTLTFEEADGPSGRGPLLIDKETGSRWLAFTGEAIDGQSKGKTLKQIGTTYAFWFGWKDHYPDTEVFN